MAGILGRRRRLVGDVAEWTGHDERRRYRYRVGSGLMIGGHNATT